MDKFKYMEFIIKKESGTAKVEVKPIRAGCDFDQAAELHSLR